MKAVLFFLIVFLWDLSVAFPGLSMDPKEEQSVPGDHTSGEPVKAPLSLKRDWSGPYVGAHLGYAGGSSQVGTTASTLGSSLNFHKGFSFSKGIGSYLGGFQAGYNYMLPWNLVLGVEGDISFPNTLTGSQQISAPSLGNVSYADTIEYFGSARSRIGYAIHNWLIYGTAGFAWSYDEFALAPVSGVPAGGNVAAGINTSTRQWRTGWTAGAGVEVALAPHWSTKIEYLFSDLGGNSVSFPAGVARLTSDLTLHEVRLGINYSLSEASAKWEDLANGRFSVHGQSTFVNQYAPGFHDPYRGTNSFIPKTGRETWDATLYLGARLWPGAELWINPEIDQGFGLSKTLGVAGYPSGEAYKVGNNFPYARIPRMFIRQTIGLSGSMEEVAPSLNQFAAARLSNRLVITAGKFGVPDVFDTNKYAHDPRNDFLNWAIVDTGTFDYAADAWGFTYGTAFEWYQNDWTLRAGVFDLSIVPNSTQLDPGFRQFQLVFEIERRHELWGQSGKLALTGYLSRGRMGRYHDAVQLAAATDTPADIAAVRRYTSRGGFSINVEQQILSDLGLFARGGLATGNIEPYEFTDVDRTIAMGLSMAGTRWGRRDDTVAIAGVINGITSAHQDFLNAGGLGILVGDGKLSNPGAEYIVEAYYKMTMWPGVFGTFDLQHITHPAYNRDRGPVWIPGFRLHAEF
jgi:high affinity Mn2+ porin